jgi:hypothetical protein
MRKSILLFSALISAGAVFAQTCPTSGLTTVATNPDTYFPGTQANVSVGATSITVGAASSGTTAISAGDLVLIIQMQGAEINSTNSDSYGDGVAGANGNGYLNNANHLAGNMEYAVASNSVPLAGGTLNISTGTIKAYQNANYATFGQYRYQVIRVPVYFNATLSASITAPAWNGTTGGVIAMQAKNNFSFAGFTIDASGKGFRGGAGRQLGGGTGANTDYTSLTSVNTNGSKGEGTAGTPRFINNNGTLLDNGAAAEGYPGGSYARGGAGNAGGGGTDGAPGSNSENSGGAGGGNGGAGGRGGNSWNSNLAIGGEPGAVFAQNAAARAVMGGGAGAASTNDGTGGSGAGFSSSGAAGGGIVILFVKNITTVGTINVNGANADNTVGNDGSGGGGAGGSILLLAGTGLANVTATAIGGNGGTNSGGGVPHGPGGGGGGGVIYASATLNVASSVAAGTAGTTSGASNFGAVNGTAGVLVQNATGAQFPAKSNVCAVLPVKLISFTYTKQNPALLLQWQATNELNVKEYELEKSFDGSTFSLLGKVASQNSSGSIKNYQYLDNAVTNAVIFYRLKIMDYDGNFAYSNIILYKQKASASDPIVLFPNPVVNSKASIFIPQQLINKPVFVKIIGPDGKMISLKQQVPYANTLTVDFPVNLHGIVLVQLVAADETILYKEKVMVK